MGVGNFNLEWLNHNSQRSYPLTAWATKRDVSDTIQIPDSFILGLEMPIHAGLDVEPENFYLKSLTITPVGYGISIGYWNDDTNPTVAVVNVSTDTHTENRIYAVPGVDDFSDTVGKICIGRLDEIEQLPPGVYQFDQEGGALEVDAVRPYIRGIVSLTVVNGNDRSVPLTGDVELVSGTNFQITVEQVEGATPRIIFSAVSGEGLNEECDCVDEDQGPCVRYVNGVGPQPDGNLPIAGDGCLQVVPLTNGIQIVDKCSKPCCKCEDLAALTSQVQRFSDGIATLTNVQNSIHSAVQTMSLSVLASRTGGNACLDCG